MTLYNEVTMGMSLSYLFALEWEKDVINFFFRFETYLPMHDLWKEYMKQTLGLTDKSKYEKNLWYLILYISHCHWIFLCEKCLNLYNTEYENFPTNFWNTKFSSLGLILTITLWNNGLTPSPQPQCVCQPQIIWMMQKWASFWVSEPWTQWL